MKHIFIVNPAAGKGASEKVHLPKIIQFLKDAGVDYEIHRTLNKQEVGTWTRQRALMGDSVRFYAIGGDGTICDVVNGVIGCSNAEVAVLPCGTGNDFVKNFTNTKNFLDLSKQLQGKSIAIDAIKYNDSYAVNMLNIGADCDVVVRAGELKEKGLATGAAAYLLGALQVLPKTPTYNMTYTFNGEEVTEDLMLVAMGNGRFCGGGFKSCPHASLTDGLLDIGVVRPCSGSDFRRMLLKYHQGTHLKDKAADKYVKYLQLKEFYLKPNEKCVVSVDGEVYECEPLHVQVAEKAINFVVPSGSELID